MNNHQELALHALDNMKGDDLYRAKHAFANMTPKQMREPHGASGKTRAEVLAIYEADDKRINDAKAWVRNAR